MYKRKAISFFSCSIVSECVALRGCNPLRNSLLGAAEFNIIIYVRRPKTMNFAGSCRFPWSILSYID